MNSCRSIRCIAVFLLFIVFAAAASAQQWKFAVMSDTQWKTSPDNKNPNSVAVNVINHLNQEFIKHGVKFVIAVGDVTDNGSNLALDTRATFAQELYNAGIGFYPLRGNHESSQAGAIEFQRVFPQTRTAQNNVTPIDAFVGNTIYGPIAPSDSPFHMGTNFSSFSDAYAGLFYSFEYENSKFILLDQFTPAVGPSHSVLDAGQVTWVGSQLANRPSGTHAFVFAHKGLITENHADTLFGSNPSVNPIVAPNTRGLQDLFSEYLYKNEVRYLFGGHDHMHQRSLVVSPDRLSYVQEITTASNSYKYYIPAATTNDEKYNLPAFGFMRETPIAQELFTVGYYIVAVDGPRVTIDFYSSPNGCSGDCDQTNDVIPYTFTKRETFGYSLNGKQFLVAQGASYTSVQDSFEETAAQILGGTNGSMMVDFNSRPLTKTVNTGWIADESERLASNILTLWGMTQNLGSCEAGPNCNPSKISGIESAVVSDKTDSFVLSIGYDHNRVRPNHLGSGGFGVATRDGNGNWINAVDRNFGGEKRFVVGPWKPGYELGAYGVDPSSKTAWAVIDYNGDFAVARDIEPVPGQR